MSAGRQCGKTDETLSRFIYDKNGILIVIHASEKERIKKIIKSSSKMLLSLGRCEDDILEILSRIFTVDDTTSCNCVRRKCGVNTSIYVDNGGIILCGLLNIPNIKFMTVTS